MRMGFRAAEVAVQEKDGVLTVVLAASKVSGGGDPDYITFQRMEGDEDGLHFEYRDQRYGDYASSPRAGSAETSLKSTWRDRSTGLKASTASTST